MAFFAVATKVAFLRTGHPSRPDLIKDRWLDVT